MVMGCFRYGSLQTQTGRAKYGNIGSIEERLSLPQHLAMIEFATHSDYVPPTPASAPRENGGAAIPFQGHCKSVAVAFFKSGA